MTDQIVIVTRSALTKNYFVLSGLPPQTLTYFLS